MSEKVQEIRQGTDEDCWLTTTLDRTLRSEVTTAAQVSSAEDSRARTVNLRLGRYAFGRL